MGADGRLGLRRRTGGIVRGCDHCQSSHTTPSGCSPSAWVLPSLKVPSSHLAMVSHPGDEAKLTEAAAEAVSL